MTSIFNGVFSARITKIVKGVTMTISFSNCSKQNVKFLMSVMVFHGMNRKWLSLFGETGIRFRFPGEITRKMENTVSLKIKKLTMIAPKNASVMMNYGCPKW